MRKISLAGNSIPQHTKHEEQFKQQPKKAFRAGKSNINLGKGGLAIEREEIRKSSSRAVGEDYLSDPTEDIYNEFKWQK